MTLTYKQELVIRLTEIEDDIISASDLADSGDYYDYSAALIKANVIITKIIEKLEVNDEKI